MKQLFLHDTLAGEMVEIDSMKDAKKYVRDNYTEGDSMHPDFYSFDIYQKVGDVSVTEDELGSATGFKVTDQSEDSEAVEFAEWIGKEDLKLYAEGWCQPGGSNGLHLSTKELYQIFKSHP